MNEVIRCLIIDHQSSSRDALLEYIDQVPFLSLVAECENALEAYAVIQSEPIDLLFIKPELPEINGIDFLKAIPADQRPSVILVSGYPEYAIAGYHLDAIDFLYRAFSFERFVLAVNKAFRRMQWSRREELAASADAGAYSEGFILVKASHKTYRIKLSEIEFIQGMKEYVAYVLPDQRILALQSLKVLMTQLPAGRFVRIHRSYIVPVEKVRAADGHHVYVGEQKLPMGGSYRDAVMQMIF